MWKIGTSHTLTVEKTKKKKKWRSEKKISAHKNQTSYLDGHTAKTKYGSVWKWLLTLSYKWSCGATSTNAIILNNTQRKTNCNVRVLRGECDLCEKIKRRTNMYTRILYCIHACDSVLYWVGSCGILATLYTTLRARVMVTAKHLFGRSFSFSVAHNSVQKNKKNFYLRYYQPVRFVVEIGLVV